MIVVLGTVPALFMAATAEAAGASFTSLQSGFTQSVYGTGEGFFGGVAFASNGDPLVDFCQFSGSSLDRFDHSTTLPLTNGTATLHPLTTEASGAGCGLANHPDGALYSNTSSGVVELDANTGVVLAGPFGVNGNALGIATDPVTGNLAYVESDGTIGTVNAGLTTSGTFATATRGDFIDQIAFDPSGNYLFLSDRTHNALAILKRDGTMVQDIPLAGGHGEPDGIAFHVSAPQFVVTNDTDGTLLRFDFPGNDFTQAPTQSVLASGGFRGDNSAVGSDTCLYLTQDGTRFDDGTTSGTNSLVRLCPGFQPSPGVGGAGVLAFGDSIAAGYGLGRSDGQQDDNPQAYPALLAARLGVAYRNYAIAGGCANSSDAFQPAGDTNCADPESVEAQIQRADPTFEPKVITLTVGADDIDFGKCLEAVVFDTVNQVSQDPCASANLSANLLAFGGALDDDLADIKSKYPGVPILMTHYYNPLPPPPSSSQSACSLYEPLTYEYLVKAGDLGEIISLFLNVSKFEELERLVQGGIFQRAKSVLGQLNHVLDTVAAENVGVSTVNLNFAGHDLCQGRNSWVFGPSIHGSAELDIGGPFGGPSVSYDFGPVPATCPDPTSPAEKSKTEYIPFGPLVKRGPHGGFSGRQMGSVGYSYSTNCLPHPTAAGQRFISEQVAKKVPG